MPSHQSSKSSLVLSLVVLCTITLYAQNIEIKGVVTNQNNVPVDGADIVV